MTFLENSDKAFDKGHSHDAHETRRKRARDRRANDTALPAPLQSIVDARRGRSNDDPGDSPRVTVEETANGRTVTYHPTVAAAEAAADSSSTTDD